MGSSFPYPIRLINIHPVSVSISVGYPLCEYPHNFLTFTDTHGYPQVFTKIKNKYLTTYFNCNSNKIQYITFINFKQSPNNPFK